MPAVDPVKKPKARKPVKVRVTVPDAGESSRTRSQPAPRVPRQADTGDRTRSNPVQETGKVRMYAHPQRPAAQAVFRQQAADEADAAKKAKALKRTIAHVRVTPVPSPDARDSARSPAQQAKDTAAAKASVQSSRVKALREQGAGSGTRAVKAFLKSNVADETQAKTTGIHGHGGSKFAVIAANLPVAGLSAKVLANAGKDAAELAVTTPSSVAKLVSTAVHDPEKVPKLLAQPYIDFAKHPLKTAEEKPVSTALMLAPGARVPGRVVGKVARAAGKQTLKRVAATMPGTALKEAQKGSRDYLVRKAQARHDAAAPARTVTVRDVHRRVDEAYGAQRKAGERITTAHMRGAHEHAKTLPADQREAYLAEQEQLAREATGRHAGEAYAQEFGANARPAVGAAERGAAKASRDAADAAKKQAKAHVRVANAEHDAAFAGAQKALARAKASPRLAALETTRNTALRAVATTQRAHASARAELGAAKGRAQVLSRNVAGRETPGRYGWAAGGHGVRLAQAAVDETAAAVKDARARVKELDRHIGAERKRISGVPPEEAQALTSAIHAREQAHTELAAARVTAKGAERAHITVKENMRNAPLVDQASEGRLFEHKADARLVAKRLSEQGVTLERGGFTAPERGMNALRGPVPVRYVIHDAGDRYAVLPDFVAERLRKQGAVGSSKAPLAKGLRVSRGMFTRAILPTRPTWLTGQAVEGAIRAGAMRAGPVSYVRARKLVDAMEREKPGSGQALMDRAVPGGRIGRVWKDFGDIGHEPRTLAEEFPESPIAHALTEVGRTPGISQVRQLYRAVTDAVFTHLNGKFLEGIPQTAMLGAALRDSPLLERSFLRVSDQAMADAAKGLQETQAQVELARAVQRAYGKYSNFGPLLREAIMHWTPFVPWLLNSARFLVRVLPADHPVLTGLLADVSVAEEDWRKANRLSLRSADHVPLFLMGSALTHGGQSLLHVGHYTPFGATTDPSSGIAGLVMPQFAGAYSAVKDGVDWKGKPLAHEDGEPFNDAEKWVYGLEQLGEALIPLASQVTAVAGAENKGAALKKQVRLMSSSASGGASAAASAPSSSGRIKIPGVGTGRIKIPGATGGRIKIP